MGVFPSSISLLSLIVSPSPRLSPYELSYVEINISFFLLVSVLRGKVHSALAKLVRKLVAEVVTA